MSGDGFEIGIDTKPDVHYMQEGNAIGDEGWLDQLLASGGLHAGSSEAVTAWGYPC